MIPATDADAAFRQCNDLGDCARILRERFPNSTVDERIEAIRHAQKRVWNKLFIRNKPRKKWSLPNYERDLAERDEHYGR